MADFTIITSNQHKLAEFKRLLPESISFDKQSIELEELQSLNLNKIVEHKVLQAYDIVKKPVIVEDVSAGLDHLNGLPGPFIKYFEEAIGRDALYKLASDNVKATVTCTIGYYDGNKLEIFSGIVHGNVVPMSTDKGFGFDGVFVPDGQELTFAEMGPEIKDAVSHRRKAVDKLVEYLS